LKTRVVSNLFVLTLGLVLTGCDRQPLPPIHDVTRLHRDCQQLFEQFPFSQLSTNDADYDYQFSLGFREIPKTRWPASVAALKPYLVCTYQGGIQLWIIGLPPSEQGKFWTSYYVVVKPEMPAPPQATTNYFVFLPSQYDGVQLLKQARF
jgi:hypothetical protein